MSDLRKLLWGLLGGVVLAAAGHALVMWRDLAVLQAKVERLESVAQYYHGEFAPQKEKTR